MSSSPRGSDLCRWLVGHTSTAKCCPLLPHHTCTVLHCLLRTPALTVCVRVCVCCCFTSLADTDVAYSLKPLWGSLLAFAEAGGADGTMQQEQPCE
jgi:hypothetical protein